MTDLFTKQLANLMNAAPYGQMPVEIQAAFQDGLSKTREATLKSIEAAKDGAEALGKAYPVAPKETAELTSKVFEQTIENTEAAFDVAQAMARARTPLEAAELQARYAQAQFAKAGAQAQELYALWARAAEKSMAGFKA